MEQSNVTYKNHWRRRLEVSSVAKVFIHRKQIKDIWAVQSSLSKPASAPCATNITSVRKETYVFSPHHSSGVTTLLEMATSAGHAEPCVGNRAAARQLACGEPGHEEQPSLLIQRTLYRSRYLWTNYIVCLLYVHYHRNLSQKPSAWKINVSNLLHCLIA